MDDDGVLFGETAVARGFISRDQLEVALARQQHESGQPLGQILVGLGLLSPPQASGIQKLTEVLQRPREAAGPDDDVPDLTGHTLGGCLVLERIAIGSMGTTFRAHHLRLDRDVVVKVLHPRLVAIEGNLARFATEARAAAKLEHPAIVSVYDFDSADGYHFIVMQYVKGQDLRKVLESRGALGLRHGLWICARVLEGLEHAHGRGIVHRDIKPANLLITPEPRVKIADFGLVRLLSRTTSEEISVFGEIIGTPQYMAPEQASGDELDQRVDIYSLGVTVFELISGRPPFTGNSTLEVLEKHIVEPLPSLPARVPEAGPSVQRFLERMCAKKLEDRFASCAEALDELQGVRGQIGATTRRLAPDPGMDPSRSAEASPVVNEAALEELKSRLRRSRSFVAFELDELEEGGAEAATDGAGGREELIEASFSSLEVQSSELRRARARLQKAAADPEKLVPRLLDSLLKQGHVDELLALQKELDALLPTSAAVAFFVGQAYERKERLEEARAKFALATALAPDHLPARLSLASVLVALKRLDEAVQALREAAGWHPTSVKAAVRLAEVLYVVLGDSEAAVPAYERAVELAPTRWQLRQQLAWILYEVGRYDQAEAVLQEVLRWSPDADPARKLLKQVRKKRQKVRADAGPSAPPPEEATETEGAGPQTSACLQAIRLASASSKFDRALELARAGLAEKPNSVPLILAEARALVLMGKLSEAVNAFGRALAQDPDNEEAQRGLIETQSLRRSKPTRRLESPPEPPAPAPEPSASEDADDAEDAEDAAE